MPLHLISVDIRLWETGKQGEKALCLPLSISAAAGDAEDLSGADQGSPDPVDFLQVLDGSPVPAGDG